VTQIGFDYHFDGIEASLDHQTFSLRSLHTNEITRLEIRLLGKHQVENASTAYVALQQLRKQGIPISKRAIHDGFANTEWPARFEILREDPPFVIDSAHNPDSAKRLRQTVEEFFPEHPIIVLIGVSEDKNVMGIIRELLPGTTSFVCSQSTHPRAMDAEKIKQLVEPFGIPTLAIRDIRTALDFALGLAGNTALVLVTGSIFVAATARISWHENMKKFHSKAEAWK
jgi:dihydrofolate synthase/folylpolyglutamate synthase